MNGEVEILLQKVNALASLNTEIISRIENNAKPTTVVLLQHNRLIVSF
jgi:hypothetical protein